MKKEIIVDKSMCIGCGACMGLDPEHFEINDEGVSEVISNENLETEELQNAIEGCPVQIIKIEEKKDNNNKEVEE